MKKNWFFRPQLPLKGMQIIMEQPMPNGKDKCSKKWVRMRVVRTTMKMISMKLMNFEKKIIVWTA